VPNNQRCVIELYISYQTADEVHWLARRADNHGVWAVGRGKGERGRVEATEEAIREFLITAESLGYSGDLNDYEVKYL